MLALHFMSAVEGNSGLQSARCILWGTTTFCETFPGDPTSSCFLAVRRTTCATRFQLKIRALASGRRRGDVGEKGLREERASEEFCGVKPEGASKSPSLFNPVGPPVNHARPHPGARASGDTGSHYGTTCKWKDSGETNKLPAT